MNGWRSVVDDPPPKERWVLVWHRGTVTLGRYLPSFPVPGVHDWLLLPPGRNPFAPFPAYHPRWWRPNLEPPSHAEDHDLGQNEEVGETLIRWRGSVSDLATDLKEFLSLDDREKLCVELVYLEARSKQPTADSFGSGSGSPPEPGAGSREPGASAPIPMLLYCPECNSRHIDRGVFATKPHHTHACQFCGLPWRPAIVPTVGVQFLPGFKNEQEVPEYLTPRPGGDSTEESVGKQSARLAVLRAQSEEDAEVLWNWPPSPPSICMHCQRLCGKASDHTSDCPERTF